VNCAESASHGRHGRQSRGREGLTGKEDGEAENGS